MLLLLLFALFYTDLDIPVRFFKFDTDALKIP